MKCQFCFIFVFCFFVLIFFGFLLFFLSEALSQDLVKISRREHNIDDIKTLFSPKNYGKTTGGNFCVEIFFSL